MQQDSLAPAEFYKRRLEEVDVAAAAQNNRRSLCQAGWLLLALLGLVLLFKSVIGKKLPIWTCAIPWAAAALVGKQAKEYRQKVLRLLSVHEYYEKGLARLKHDWETLDAGADFADPDHLYATDLDLFGRGSLFQLLCSTRTHIGRETLANWMKVLASPDEVLDRREAISELRARRELAESVASAGNSTVFDCRPGTFQKWVAEIASQSPFPSWAPIMAWIFVFVLVGLPILYLVGHLTLQTLWVSLAVLLAAEALFAWSLSAKVRFILESLSWPSVELPIICDLLAVIEREQFSSKKLTALKNRLNQPRSGASSSMQQNIRHLKRLIRLVQQRKNPLLEPISYCLLWGTQGSMALDRWHRRHGSDLLECLGILGDFEALLSLGTYSFEHPRDVFPEISEAGPLLSAEKLCHPLLDEGTCVPNDVQLGGEVRFLIVSGSNMSGKSTFLRAVGVNVMLAWMGAPVRCARLRLSRLGIAAAIRLQDSVTDGRSHFFAEMQRLRRTIDLADETPILFLMDEIMSGTNSHDRRIAAEWVVRALVRRNAIGLITTHDLTLTEIAMNGLPGRNVYFEDSGEAGTLHFDYKLRSGLLTHSNALNIVRMLGIDTET